VSRGVGPGGEAEAEADAEAGPGTDAGAGEGAEAAATAGDGPRTTAERDGAATGLTSSRTDDADDADDADGGGCASSVDLDPSAGVAVGDDPRRVTREASSGLVRETGRWDGALAAGVLLGGLGVLLGNATVALAATVPFAFAVYAAVTADPDPALRVERTVSDAAPAPGAAVSVTVAVTNEGDGPLPDLRVVDGVPPALPVTAGSPRAVASLAAGETALVEYEVPARRGTHEFGPVTLLARDLAGTTERRETLALETTLSVDETAEPLPLRARTTGHAGRVPTDVGGEGLEFHAVRQHHHADPMSRIDWKRYARTRELTTVEFREERAASLVVLVDDREAARRARRPGEPTAVELASFAAVRVAEAHRGRGDAVGVATLDGGVYLPPAVHAVQGRRVEAVLDGDVPDPARRLRTASVDRLERHLPGDSQVLLVSPLLDDGSVAAARHLDAYGHPVTVLSPDVTGGTTGGRVAALGRRGRLTALRSDDLPVLEWSPDEPLRAAVERARGRWSR
jgi:uncharacterized protein (DUF58 family)